MNKITDLLFEANILKELPRSGYYFLGSGHENVAEHSFMTAFIAFIISQIVPDLDSEKLITMALIHDLPEARTGDLNYVQKKYVKKMEGKAVSDMTQGLLFGKSIKKLIKEFNQGETVEAKLANDADQLSFILELKKLQDTGAKSPEKWLPIVIKRVKTKIGKKLAKNIMSSNWDNWWMNNYSD
ncbi:MAG: metal-dependent phosphohydrolase [Desulfobacteraceae bacterium 4572_130]|nr:MAG: metal-dependent phosphohydrolase [Desulfobacteraceae bacterium 4572_130]